LKNKILIVMYSMLIACCVIYVYYRINLSHEGTPVEYIEVSEVFENSPYAGEEKSIIVITEYTSCSVCLAEIDEFYKAAKDIDTSIAFSILLLDANLEETTLFEKSM